MIYLEAPASSCIMNFLPFCLADFVASFGVVLCCVFILAIVPFWLVSTINRGTFSKSGDMNLFLSRY